MRVLRAILLLIALVTGSCRTADGQDLRDHNVLPLVKITPLLQPVIDSMWRTSPTFRAQCARLRQAPSLLVTVSIGSRPRVGAARGRVYVDRSAGLAARADILIAQDFRSFAELVEVLAHELEHVIEQLDGVELRADSSHGVYQLADGSFETARAVHIGQQVAGEVDAAGRVARKEESW
jgi:hypothetical protein